MAGLPPLAVKERMGIGGIHVIVLSTALLHAPLAAAVCIQI
jgi:hypothetical protein